MVRYIFYICLKRSAGVPDNTHVTKINVIAREPRLIQECFICFIYIYIYIYIYIGIISRGLSREPHLVKRSPLTVATKDRYPASDLKIGRSSPTRIGGFSQGALLSPYSKKTTRT